MGKPEVDTIRVLSSISLHSVFWDKVTHWTSLELSHWLGYLTSKPPGSTHLYLLQHPELSLQAGVITSSFCMGSRELNSNLHACKVSSLPTKPFPHLSWTTTKKLLDRALLNHVTISSFFLGKVFKLFTLLVSWMYVYHLGGFFLLVLKGSTGFMSLSLFPLFSITFYFFYLLLF